MLCEECAFTQRLSPAGLHSGNYLQFAKQIARGAAHHRWTKHFFRHFSSVSFTTPTSVRLPFCFLRTCFKEAPYDLQSEIQIPFCLITSFNRLFPCCFRMWFNSLSIPFHFSGRDNDISASTSAKASAPLRPQRGFQKQIYHSWSFSGQVTGSRRFTNRLESAGDVLVSDMFWYYLRCAIFGRLGGRNRVRRCYGH